MVAIDCSTLAYLLLSAEYTPRARTLFELDADWHSDAFVLIEFTNVLATAMRIRGLPQPQAATALTKAQSVLESGLHLADHSDVLALAAQLKVSAYDARYLTTARNLGVRLVTEDTKLRKAAPRLTQSLADALTAAETPGQ